MAQLGSVAVTVVNAFSASSNQKECCMATARWNCACASALHETGKCTVPSFSGSPAVCWCSSCAKDQVGRKRMTQTNSRYLANRMVSPFLRFVARMKSGKQLLPNLPGFHLVPSGLQCPSPLTLRHEVDQRLVDRNIRLGQPFDGCIMV